MLKFKSFTDFVKYHWKVSPVQAEEPDRWSNRVVFIELASENPFKQPLDRYESVIRKSKRLFKNVTVSLCNLFKIKPANRILFYSSLLKEKNKDGIYKGVCYCPESFQPTFLITDPNIITAILMHERNEVGIKAMFSGGATSQTAKKILGNNILTCDEVEHKSLQQFSTPHFTSLNITPYFGHFLRNSSKLIQKWANIGKEVPVDISRDLPVFAAQAVAESLIGFQDPIEDLCQAMHTLLEINKKWFVFPKSRKRYNRALKFIQAAAEKACKGQQHNFLKCMREAKDKQGQPRFQMSNIISMAKILFFAGQDTTSSLLAFLFHTLGQPEFVNWQEKLHDEFNKSDGDLLKFIQESQDLDNIIKEGLRIHPSAFTQTREVVQDIVIDKKIYIPKGSLIHLLHYFSQRDLRRWGPEASDFNPSRFKNPLLNAKIHGPLQYFSLGPSICLGRHFVTLLMKTFLMQMIRTVQWSSCMPLPNIEADTALELKPFVHIKLSKRENYNDSRPS